MKAMNYKKRFGRPKASLSVAASSHQGIDGLLGTDCFGVLAAKLGLAQAVQPLELRKCLVIVVHVAIEHGEILETVDDILVLVTQEVLAHKQGFLVERQSGIVVPATVVGCAQAGHRRCRVDVQLANVGFADVKGLAQVLDGEVELFCAQIASTHTMIGTASAVVIAAARLLVNIHCGEGGLEALFLFSFLLIQLGKNVVRVSRRSVAHARELALGLDALINVLMRTHKVAHVAVRTCNGRIRGGCIDMIGSMDLFMNFHALQKALERLFALAFPVVGEAQVVLHNGNMCVLLAEHLPVDLGRHSEVNDCLVKLAEFLEQQSDLVVQFGRCLLLLPAHFLCGRELCDEALYRL
eukprot:m.13939 g.13939  ORF g.13939 m.13939 type:complete len:353 (+) comp3333_c0_seq1:239-1297(+)